MAEVLHELTVIKEILLDLLRRTAGKFAGTLTFPLHLLCDCFLLVHVIHVISQAPQNAVMEM